MVPPPPTAARHRSAPAPFEAVGELADLEATFLPGTPPRAGRLALWRAIPDAPLPSPEPVAGADRIVTLVLPAGRSVRRREVRALALPIATVVDQLVELHADEPARPSLRAWSAGARLAVELVARGRLLPRATDAGHDAWQLGPLDPDDIQRRQALAEALPPAAHACGIPDSSPLRITGPQAAVAAFSDAVADTLVRSAAAAVDAGHRAFATEEPITLEGDALAWLHEAATGDDAASLSLRLLPPPLHDEHDAHEEPEDPGDDSSCRAVLQLHSRRDPSLVIDAAQLWDAPDAVAERFGPDVDLDVLVTLRRAATVFPPLRRMLDEARPEQLVLADEEAAELLGPVVEDLASAGLQVLWPAELVRPLEVRATVSPAPAAVTGAGLTLDAMLELSWAAELDGEPLDPTEIAALAEAKRGIVRLRGRWVRADPDQLARLRAPRPVGAGEALAAALDGHLLVDGESVQADVEGPLATLAERLRLLTPERELCEPDGLEAELRPYQRRGLAWLVELTQLGLGGILADDMGLGKTIQVLALLAHRREKGDDGPVLVVCPVTLLANWEREADRFVPDLPLRRYHGTGRTLEDLAPGELVLATYGIARRDLDELARVPWSLVVADEAQAAKNPLSGTARALRALRGRARFALTGTPVENRLTELWSLVDWTTPGLLGPLERFRRQVAVPVERDRDPAATETLTRVVRPFLLRRRKSDPSIAPDLPPKTETDRLVPLTKEQLSLYEAVVREVMAEIREAEGIARRGLVLRLIGALKQVCNHPAQYLDQDGPLEQRSGKLDATTELVEVIRAEGDAVLVFTQYVRMGRLLERHLAERGATTAFLHGRVPARRRQDLVDAFQAGEHDVFVISLRAGGTGLNLTRATHVIHFDRWWNPAVEDQASDRAWRIGQDRAVQVHRLLCEGTLEERIADVLSSKRDLADAVVGGGEGWITELGDEELAELVGFAGHDLGGAPP